MRSSEPCAIPSPGRRLRVWAALVAMLALPLAITLVAAAAATRGVLQQNETLLEVLPRAQQQEFGRRLAAWNALPRVEREDRRARYMAWLQLPADERVQLRALAAQVAAFPPDRAQALRAQFDALEEVQRRGWRLGPTLGRDYAVLFPLLAYVPESQRQPLLARLRGLESAQRADLGVLMQRTPPQDRAALREELLAVPPGTLAGWLKHKLDQ